MNERTPRNFDDFAVGQSASLERVVTADDVAAFAALTGDDNPVHLDSEYAAALGLGERLVHGMLTAGYISTLIGTTLPGPGALWMSERFNFRAPLRVGDRIRAEVTVRHLSAATRTLVLDVEVRNQRGTVVLDGEAHVQVPEPSALSDDEAPGIESVVVTGSGRGIGAAIAKRLAASGMRVMLNYRNDEARATETLTAITEAGGQASLFRADVSEPAQAAALIAHARDTFGSVDALVNNAGGGPEPRRLGELSWEDVQRHLASHLRSAFVCAQEVLPQMIERRSGRIVNVTSQSAYGTPPPKMTGYVVAKAALAAFTRCLALEAGPHGVTVNAVAPGMADTELVADVSHRAKAVLASQTPLRRLAEVDDVAQTVAFLLGPGGTYLTGQTIHLSGGQVMT